MNEKHKFKTLRNNKKIEMITSHMHCDLLYQNLQKNLRLGNNIIIWDYFYNELVSQVVISFLSKYRRFLKTCIVDFDENDKVYKCSIVFLDDSRLENFDGYLQLKQSYSSEYYLSDCGGYEVFQRSSGKKVDERLLGICGLVQPENKEKILDVGCGRGELSYLLHLTGADVIGVDYSSDAILIANTVYEPIKEENLNFVCKDIFDFDNNMKFDKIVIADVVEHIDEDLLYKMMEKLHCILNETGYVVVHTAPNKNYYDIVYEQKRQQAQKLGLYLPVNPRSYYEDLMHINEQTPQSLRKVLEDSFKFVHVWCGNANDIITEKSNDEMNKDVSMFAIACDNQETYLSMMKSYTSKPDKHNMGVYLYSDVDMISLPKETELEYKIKITNTGKIAINSF